MKSFKCILLTNLIILITAIDDSSVNDIGRIQALVNEIAESTYKIAHWYVEKLDTKLSNVMTKLTNIENAAVNIQEKSHVWETLQLHVSAWNEQSLSMERKLGILSRSGERLETSADKLSILNSWDSKINFIVDALKDFKYNVSRSDDIIVVEFAKRGALSVLNEIHDGMQIMMSNCSYKVPVLEKVDKNSTASLDSCGFKSKPVLVNITRQFQNIETLIRKRESLFTDLYDDFKAYINSPVHKKMRKSYMKMEDLIDNLDSIYASKPSSTETITLDDFRRELEIQLNIFEARLDKHTKVTNLQLDKIYKKLIDQENQIEKCTANRPDMTDCSSCKKTENVKNEAQFYDACAWNLKNGNNNSGVFEFHDNKVVLDETALPIQLDTQFCDNTVNGGGWTVISRRGEHLKYGKVDFNRTWEDYEKGFGHLDGEFWLGNEKIHRLTEQNDMILRVDLEDFEGKRVFAEYGTFVVHGADKSYEAWIGGYFGNATDSFSAHSGSKFSTHDRTNDDAPPCCPCAPAYGGGWWFYSCFESNLNGLYFDDPVDNGYFEGIIWEKWKGDYSLKKAEMKLRPKWLEDYLIETSNIENRYTFVEDP